MTEDRDSKIADLYQQSSQETPPAHLDQAVLDRARKSVRRRGYSPFGNHWIAGGAMVGVIMLSVLLILDMPQPPEPYVPVQDAVTPPGDAPSETRKEVMRSRALSSELSAAAEKKREAPAAPKVQFDSYERLPEMEVVMPEEEPRAVMNQAPAAAEPAGLAARVPPGTFYLQAGLFSDKALADALKVKLTGLGFKCEIREVSSDDTDVFYYVRAGPFADLEALNKSRQKLDESGVETRPVKE